MWITTPMWAAFVVAHRERSDLLVCKFRTQQDADQFIHTIDRFVGQDDLEQRRALVYGLTPGQKDYYYRIHVRREYVAVAMHYAIESIDYGSLVRATEDRSPRGVVSNLRTDTIEACHAAWFDYQENAWEKKEHTLSKAHLKPVYTPEAREETDVTSPPPHRRR